MTGVEAKILMMTGKNFKEVLNNFFEENKTTREIGHELSISDGSVRLYAKKYGITARQNGVRLKDWGWSGITKKN